MLQTEKIFFVSSIKDRKFEKASAVFASRNYVVFAVRPGFPGNSTRCISKKDSRGDYSAPENLFYLRPVCPADKFNRQADVLSCGAVGHRALRDGTDRHTIEQGQREQPR